MIYIYKQLFGGFFLWIPVGILINSFAACSVAGGQNDQSKIIRDVNPETPGVESWSVTCPYQEGTNKLEVLLPDNLDTKKLHPVVYCLPVNATTKGDWGHPLTEAKKHDLANKYQCIFACPAYSKLPWYGSNPLRPEMRQSPYLLEVVIPFIEKTYPVIPKPEGRYLIGFSKSGLGALGLFLRKPESFAKVAIFETWWGIPNDKQWKEWGFSDCYGSRENFDTWEPAQLIDKYRKELAEGPSRIIVLNGGARQGSDALKMKLADAGIPFTEIVNSKWNHDWRSGWFPRAVAAMAPDASKNSDDNKK